MLETLPRRFESRIPRRRCKQQRRGKPFVAATLGRSRSYYIWSIVTITRRCRFADKYVSETDVLVACSFNRSAFSRIKSCRITLFVSRRVGFHGGNARIVKALGT